MRLPRPLLAFALALPAMATSAADPAAAAAGTVATPLRGQDCLDPNRTRSFLATGDKEIIVDAGKRKYRLTLGQSCPAMSYTQVLSFRGDQIDGRLCGGINDAVVTTDYPCKVARVDLIDDAQYKQASDAYVAERKARRNKKPAIEAAGTTAPAPAEATSESP